MDLATEQFVDGFVHVFADDVPAGHLDGAQNSHHGGVRAVDKAAAVDAAPDFFDVKRLFANDVTFDHIFGHLCHDVWVKGQVVDFTQAFNAVVGNELDEDEVAPSVARRGIADDESFNILDFHKSFLLIVVEMFFRRAAPRKNAPPSGGQRSTRSDKRGGHIHSPLMILYSMKSWMPKRPHSRPLPLCL